MSVTGPSAPGADRGGRITAHRQGRVMSPARTTTTTAGTSPGAVRPARTTGDVVVGVADTGSCAQTLSRARLEAVSRAGRLVLLHAWSTPVWLSDAQGAGALPSPQECLRSAHEFVGSLLTGDEGSSVRVTVQEGEPGHVLVRASDGAGLLVVGGQGRVPGGMLGLATSYLLQHARCAVMIVPHAQAAPAPFARVVVGLDGVESSHSALIWAAEAAARYRSPLIVLHAWTTASSRRLPTGVSLAATEEQRVEQRALQREVSLLLPERPEGTEVLARYGEVGRVLLDEAGVDDLLVVGLTGRSTVADPVTGSVATQCAHFARGTVVVVRDGPAG